MKNIIINADDLGISKEVNTAVKLGHETGIINSTSLIVNMDGFDSAVNEIIPAFPKLNIGVHLNIMEGKSLTNVPLLCDKNGFFNNGYINLILKSKQKEFINQTEQEFRAQIEKAMKYCKIKHIDSHVHVHAIPEIFNLTLKLAQEYGIKNIRTQKEIPYIVFSKIFNKKFPVNIIKNILLNIFTDINLKSLKKYPEIKTNDYFIGVLYTGYMDEKAILNGIKKIKRDNSVTEVIFHPYFSDNINKAKTNNYGEFLITQNPNFKTELENLGVVFSIC